MRYYRVVNVFVLLSLFFVSGCGNGFEMLGFKIGEKADDVAVLEGKFKAAGFDGEVESYGLYVPVCGFMELKSQEKGECFSQWSGELSRWMSLREVVSALLPEIKMDDIIVESHNEGASGMARLEAWYSGLTNGLVLIEFATAEKERGEAMLAEFTDKYGEGQTCALYPGTNQMEVRYWNSGDEWLIHYTFVDSVTFGPSYCFVLVDWKGFVDCVDDLHQELKPVLVESGLGEPWKD